MQRGPVSIMLKPANEPLDLAPAAEMEDIAPVAAVVGARRRGDAGRCAIEGDQPGGVHRRGAVEEEAGLVHGSRGFSRKPLPKRRPRLVKHCLAIGDGKAMSEPGKSGGIAGGVFIALGAIGGAVAGAIAGEPSIGFLAGMGAGLLIAALIWWRAR